MPRALLRVAMLGLLMGHAVAVFANDTIIRASEVGARLDSDLLKGGGSDDTKVLQGALDRAKRHGRVHLIVDGAALVSGLEVHGNTLIECPPGAGFFLKNGSDRAIIRNAHRSRTTITDEHIRIRGCFFNGNREGQQRKGGPFQLQGSAKTYYYSARQEEDGTFKSGLQFFGVNDVSIEQVTLWNTRAFGAWFANAKRINLRDIYIDSRLPPFPSNMDPAEYRKYFDQYRSNDDGLHFNGPIQYLTIEGLSLRGTEDDGIGLNANDMGVNDMTVRNEMGPYVGQGPITDVIVRNVTFMDVVQGLRLLSSDQRIDRVVIENVTGTVRSRGIILSHFVDRLKSRQHGNFGSVIFNNINVDPLPFPKTADIYHGWSAPAYQEVFDSGEEGDMPLFSLNSPIDHLSLNAVATKVIDDRPLIRVGRDAVVRIMNVELNVIDPAAQSTPLYLVAGGRVERLNLSLNWLGKDGEIAKPAIQNAGGTIGRLNLSGAVH